MGYKVVILHILLLILLVALYFSRLLPVIEHLHSNCNFTE